MKKKLAKFLVFILFICVFVSCSQNDAIEKAAIPMNNKTSFTISDFPSDKVFKSSDYKSVLDQYNVGASDSNAVVALLFDKEGILYTGQRYNEEVDKSNISMSYVTDLKTFKSVTGFEYASKAYSKAVLVRDNQLLWIFDPYQKFYKSRTEIESLSKALSVRSSVSASTITITILQGDLLYAPDGAGTAGTYLGHVAGFYSLPPLCGDINALMSGATVIEADWLKVYKRLMNVYWTGHHGIRVIKYKAGLTAAQRTTIITYLNNQVGEPYFFSAKTNESSWYCSKLVWKAYKQIGVDIDYDAGYEVTPTDILNSSLLTGYLLN